MDHDQATAVQVCMDENKDCHAQLKKGTSTDWFTLLEIALIAGALGYVGGTITK